MKTQNRRYQEQRPEENINFSKYPPNRKQKVSGQNQTNPGQRNQRDYGRCCR